jgi:hypothetical protein
MDDRRFDTLARSIGAIRSRRSVLATLTAAALAGKLGLDERAEAAAPKPSDAKCSSDAQCISGTCLKYGKCKKDGKLTGKCRCACDTHEDCGTDRLCRNRACFSKCPLGGTCGAFQGCGSGNCGCFETTDADAACAFTGKNTCLTDACTTGDDCPDGYVCGVIEPGGSEDCCNGKERTCLAPCQAKSVQPAPLDATASRDRQDGGGRDQSIGGH